MTSDNNKIAALEIKAIKEYEGGSQISMYMAKGHWPVDDFLAQLKTKFGVEVTPGEIKRCCARNVPAGRDNPGQYGIYLTSHLGRGAYLVTVYER